MAAGQNGYQVALEHHFLAENHGPDRGLGGADVLGGRLGGPDDHVF